MKVATQRRVLDWYSTHARDFPWRRTRDPYNTLVAEVMLQQTQTGRVATIFEAFLARFPDVQTLAGASPADVISAWRGLGYNRRALALHRAAHAVVKDYGGKVPADPKILRNLPGVGVYTASAIACFAFGHDVPVIDVNVRRVIARSVYGADLAETDTRAVDETAAKSVLSGRAYEWNQALMDVGATLCRARKPACEGCPLASDCAYRERGRRPQSPSSAKAAFKGSRRQIRGAVLNALRDAPRGLSRSGLAQKVAALTGVNHSLGGVIDDLVREGFVEWGRGVIRLRS